MNTAMKHPVPDRVKPSFVILTSGHSDTQPWASECPDVKNYKWWLNPVCHRMLYSCTEGVKRLNINSHWCNAISPTQTSSPHYPVWRLDRASPFSLSRPATLMYLTEFGARAPPMTMSSISRSTGRDPFTVGPCTQQITRLRRLQIKLSVFGHPSFLNDLEAGAEEVQIMVQCVNTT